MKRKIYVVLAVFLCVVAMCVLLAACNDGTQNNTEQPGDGNPPSETPVDPGTETPGTGDEPGVDDPEDPAPSQPETYSVTFVADGNVVSVVSYSENTATISEPSVPNKTGYTGAWEPYSLGAANITVNAVYTPIEYTVTFVADGETVGTAVYTVENHAIEEPSIPSKAHYTATWEEYTLTTGDLTVNAVYTLTEYTITFIADGKTVGKVGYTIEDDAVTEPQVPYKENCIGTWEDYTLSGGDLTVNAVYITTMDFALTADNSFYVVLRYNGNEEEVEVPAMYNGLRVMAIAENAFAGNTATRKITLPNSIEQIQSGAFSGCTSLADINIPANVQLIGDNAFEGCTSLQTISLGRSVTTIGESAFANCTALRSIALNEGLTAIGTFAFDGCTALTDITLPNSLNSLGTGVFRHAESLETVNIPSLITAIPNVTFQYCRSLKNIVIPATVSGIGQSAFSYCYGLENLRLEGNINTIGDSAFFNCYSLTTVYYNSSTRNNAGDENYIFYNAGTSSDGITLTLGANAVIPDNLFDPLSDANKPFITEMVFEDGRTSITSIYPEGLPYLKSVTIPDSVTTIEANAFNGCEGALRNENGVNYADDWAISCDAGITLLTLADGIRGIADSAFEDRFGVISITIPSSVADIGDYAFSGCTAEIIWEDEPTIQKIGELAFAGYAGTTLTIPNSVTTLEDYAFADCTGLTSIIIPDSVTSIGDGAFSGCRSLESITIPFVGAEAGKTSSDTYQYPFGYIFGTSSYEGGTGVSHSSTYYIPSSLRNVTVTGGNILQGAFNNCSMLTSITIPDSATSIASGALNGCSALESITIPFVGAEADKTSSDTYQYPFGYIFGTSSYEGGTGVSQDYYSNSTSFPTSSTYYIPSSLRSVTVTGGEILYGAFYNCSMLTSVTIPDSVTSIGSYAFRSCSGLTSITIPDSVTSIGNYVFYSCTGLTSVTIPDSVTSIGSSAFYDCDGLTSITIPDSVTSIGNYVFYSCTGLTSVTIGNGVTSIGNYAFDGCTSLTTITIPDSVTSIGYSAFSGCSSLESITIPFVGGSAGKTSSDTYQYPFGYIFGTSSYTGGTAVKQYYYGRSTSSTTYSTYYIPSSLRSVTVTGGNILYGAFYGCSMLTSVTIGDRVTSIGSYAFSGCSGLTSITIPDSVTSIGSSAFEGCTSLTSVTIPDSVTSIGSYAFLNCTGLTSVTFKVTTGWYRTSSSSATSWTSLSSSSLANPSTAATWLASTYSSYYWKR